MSDDNVTEFPPGRRVREPATPPPSGRRPRMGTPERAAYEHAKYKAERERQQQQARQPVDNPPPPSREWKSPTRLTNNTKVQLGSGRRVEITESTSPADETIDVHVVAIKRLTGEAEGNAIEVGRRLVQCRKEFPSRAEWRNFLRASFDWTVRNAENYVATYKRFRNPEDAKRVSHHFSVRTQFLLGRASTPDEVVDEVLNKADEGEAPGFDEVKAAIAAAKPAKSNDAMQELLDDIAKKNREAMRLARKGHVGAVAAARDAIEAWGGFIEALEKHKPNDVA
jgi:hypothetical protein